jgi:phosphatidylethanolamine N-methyltransferase
MVLPLSEKLTTVAGETETEPELPELPTIPSSNPSVRNRSDSTFSSTSFCNGADGSYSASASQKRAGMKRSKSISMHDLTHRFFRQPMVVLSRLDMFR